jgi:hypothetical protein
MEGRHSGTTGWEHNRKRDEDVAEEGPETIYGSIKHTRIRPSDTYKESFVNYI